jgi:CheY-like chemotaxis protein
MPERTAIAIVEDNADNRLLVVALLEDDYDVVEFEDGTSALAGLADSGVRLVLLDISLPGMDGSEVLRGIRADPALQGLPVCALTAHAMMGDRERYLAEGFDGYISKPIVDEDVLFETLKTLLARD